MYFFLGCVLAILLYGISCLWVISKTLDKIANDLAIIRLSVKSLKEHKQ